MFSKNFFNKPEYKEVLAKYTKLHNTIVEEEVDEKLVRFFNEFATNVRLSYASKIEISDLISPLCNKKEAYVFKLDKSKHFWE
mmetsp:Transcript_2484/g.2434  ORF Transcript_2484/g.2434 Transcript_2484/m.2434 type:complete len:83 (+) Transcript_2484:550-798(+)